MSQSISHWDHRARTQKHWASPAHVLHINHLVLAAVIYSFRTGIKTPAPLLVNNADASRKLYSSNHTFWGLFYMHTTKMYTEVAVMCQNQRRNTVPFVVLKSVKPNGVSTHLSLLSRNPASFMAESIFQGKNYSSMPLIWESQNTRILLNEINQVVFGHKWYINVMYSETWHLSRLKNETL